jgi:hypothetical protein
MEKGITEICDDLKKFANMVNQRTSNAVDYDSSLKIPAWRKNGVENYLANVQADVAKFLIHADLMQNTNDLINDESINKVILSKISQRFTGHAELYLSTVKNPAEKKFCEGLIADLGSVKNMLAQYSRPADPGSRPHA